MLDGLEPLPTEEVALDDALGRVVAVPVTSMTTLPPWDNSAMDGFALALCRRSGRGNFARHWRGRSGCGAS